MKNLRKALSILLAVCMVFVFSNTAFAAEKGYSTPIRSYLIYGIDGNPNVAAYAYLYGDKVNTKNNYAVAIIITKDGYSYIDVLNTEEFTAMVNNSLESSQVEIDNLNQLMLSYGAPDELLLLEEKPYVVYELEKAAAAGKTTATIDNQLVVLPDAIRLAAEKGITKINFDTVYEGAVICRVTVDTAKNTSGFGVEGNGFSSAEDGLANTMNTFYTNKYAQVDFAQYGSFGSRVKVAVKVEGIEELNKNTLIFTHYDRIANKMIRIENTEYYFDDNGYLHFYTDYAGTIVITDSPLTRK